jgi:ABC-type nitrate/sulfonate/bicarbonate transport system ATPase subunit
MSIVLMPWLSTYENVYLAYDSGFPNKSHAEKDAVVTEHLTITKEEMQEELAKICLDHRCTVLMVTHDIDKCLFLADRLVMMTNGPAASLGEILDIPFPRPRDRAQVMEDPEYYRLRNAALEFL